MNVEQSLSDFIDFYLSPVLSKKSIELLKIKLRRHTSKIEDPLLKDVTLVRHTLGIMQSRRKGANFLMPATTWREKLYFELLRLAPRDCLVLVSQNLFSIPLPILSLALNTPRESLEYRQSQLTTQFRDDGFDLGTLNAASLIEGGFSTPPLAGNSAGGLFQYFQRLPIAVRFTLETTVILFGLLGLLWLIPEIRNRYENSIQRRINDYLIESSLVDSPPPAGTTKAKEVLPAVHDPEQAEDADEAAGVNKSSSDELSSRKQPKVNEGETWRFSFTGASTVDIETGITDALHTQSITFDKPLTVPGGIQFNFVLPNERLIPLKNALEQIVTDIQTKSANRAGGANLASFSWYKKRNMGTRKIPSGHVQIIIWISTL